MECAVSIPNRERDLLRHSSLMPISSRPVVSIPNRERDLLRLLVLNTDTNLASLVSIPNRERDLLRLDTAGRGDDMRDVSIPNRERDLLRRRGLGRCGDRRRFNP